MNAADLAVDPRTIAANAIGWLNDDANGWTRRFYGWHCPTTGASILADRLGIHLNHGGETVTLAEFGDDEEPSETAARAVDKLCADGHLPHRLSTGWQAAAQQWAAEVAQAREDKRLAQENARDLASQLVTLDEGAAKVVREYAAEVRELRRQLAEARTRARQAVAA